MQFRLQGRSVGQNMFRHWQALQRKLGHGPGRAGFLPENRLYGQERVLP